MTRIEHLPADLRSIEGCGRSVSKKGLGMVDLRRKVRSAKSENRAIMIIKKILLALVGAVVGLAAGVIIAGLSTLVGVHGLSWEFVYIVWGLCAIAGGYLAFVGAVSMRVLFLLFFLVVVCPVTFLNSLPHFDTLMNPALTTAEVRQILEKCSCEPEIQAEVDSIISLGDVLSVPTPALDRFNEARSNKILNDRAWWIKGLSSGFISRGDWWIDRQFILPGHVRFRFGPRSHFQYIRFFPTGASLPPSGLEHVTGNVYFQQ